MVPRMVPIPRATELKNAARVRVVEPFVPFVVGAEGATRRNAVMSAMDGDGGVRGSDRSVRG